MQTDDTARHRHRQRDEKQTKEKHQCKGIETDKIEKRTAAFATASGTSFLGVACSRLPNVCELERLPFHSAIREMARGSYYCNMPCDENKKSVHSRIAIFASWCRGSVSSLDLRSGNLLLCNKLDLQQN